MLLTFQDRLRIPWRGGAKQVTLECLLPVFVIPVGIIFAAGGLLCTITTILVGLIFVGSAYRYALRTSNRTCFFFMWLLWSLIYIVVFFEMTAPLLELLPEENLILTLLAVASFVCLIRAKVHAKASHVVQSTVAEDELPDITEATTAEEEEAAATQTTLLMEHDDIMEATAHPARYQPNICANCHKYVPSRTAHCTICGACIMRRDHHSFWLNCCIGEKNHRYYFVGLVLAEMALLLGANLTLTAVCHPFLVVRLLGIPLMLPDDCSEVFDDYQLGISFVIALYALMMALCVLAALLRQIYFISRGITMQEHQAGQAGNRKTCWNNWKAFLF